ncbi:TetR/AcrR family transcriptional regulator [Marinomonas ostreistagni]|uniref:TetR/AcrR family transcriptional regulator n=1 Tax=Marinomonas ostreistagni TaxID=359209 RepID=A0ABS0ZET7_9GAMM|nr:TetR/AcrR family transcriptional regulator [Marinomonas ostreistagni]MBJ7552179.1 TetR/AcrR family transcriptional regulator [Marinomonas ostreistagni]
MTKRDELIKTAFELFYLNGVHSVGINQILAETGVAKKTLYTHFASKEALLEAVIAYRDERFRTWIFGLMDQYSEAETIVKAMFDGLDDWFNDRVDSLMSFQGCFFVKVNAEFVQHRVNDLCFEHKQAIVNYLLSALSAEYGEDRARTMADQVALLKEGAITQAYLGKDRQAAIKAWHMAKTLFR